VAIDNAVTRLYRSGVTSVVRLSSRDDKVDPEASHLLLSNKLAAWATEIGVRARERDGRLGRTRKACRLSISPWRLTPRRLLHPSTQE